MSSGATKFPDAQWGKRSIGETTPTNRADICGTHCFVQHFDKQNPPDSFSLGTQSHFTSLTSISALLSDTSQTSSSESRPVKKLRYEDLPTEVNGKKVGFNFWQFQLIAREVLLFNRGAAFGMAVQSMIGGSKLVFDERGVDVPLRDAKDK